MQAHHRLYTGFFIFAFTMGSLFSRIPDIQLAFGATESALGMMLMGLSVGALTGLTLAAPIINRLGVRSAIAVPLFGIAFFCSLVPHMPGMQLAFASLFCVGVLVGALEVCLNVETDRHGALLGRGIMSRAHSLWSFGLFGAALLGSLVRQLGISTALHLGALVPAVLLAIIIIVRNMEAAPHRADNVEAPPPMFTFPTFAMLGICLLTFSPLLVEGAGVDWSVIYMRDIFATEPLVSGMALTGFTLLMALSRWFADPVIQKFGDRRVGGALLLLCATGVTLVGFAPSPAIAILGFSLMGIGCSALYPMAVSAVAQRTDRPPAINVAALGQASFVVFFVAPPLLGFIAEFAGIRNAYLFCLPLIGISLLCLGSLAKPKSPQTIKKQA